MKYFKNTELARLYGISEKSVRNWIQAATEGKLDLQLHEENGKYLIVNTARNTYTIEKLVVNGKKYKNTRGYKVVSPSDKFYELYNTKQIIDIMSNLDIYREVPLQYSYFNSGAERWDHYTQNLLNQKELNSLTNTIQLIDLNLEYLDTIVEGCKGVNIVDIGVGNALPIRNVIKHFKDKGMLKRYVGIDISKELLGIAEKNINEWFNGEVHVEGHVRDINYERFNDLLVSESFDASESTVINLVFFLGGTISNFREPSHSLSTIHESMGKRDILVFSKKLDTERSRRYFEMVVSGNQEIDLVLKLLNIDASLYELEPTFNPVNMAREARAKLKVALAIKFKLNGEDKIVEFNKGESILLWRARHQNTVETITEFDINGFDFLQAERSKDLDYLLLTSKIKSL